MFRASILALSLTVSSAQAAEGWTEPSPGTPDLTFRYDTAAPVFFAQEAPVEPSATAVPEYTPTVDMARYSMHMRTARIGLGVGIGGVALATVGVSTLLIAALAENEAMLAGGIGMVLVGGLGYVAGAPIMNAGAMSAGRTLQRGQVDVGLGASNLSWMMMGTSLVIAVLGTSVQIPALSTAGSVLFLGSYVMAGVQMSANGLARPSPTVALLPDLGNRGLRIAGRF